MTIQIQTVKAREHYRAKINGQSYVFMLTVDRDMVAIYSPSHMLGLWKLDRFNGELSRASIRSFAL